MAAALFRVDYVNGHPDLYNLDEDGDIENTVEKLTAMKEQPDA